MAREQTSTIPWDQRKTVRIREIANYTGISRTAIYGAIQEGKLPARKVGNKMWVVDPKDVDIWLGEGQDAVSTTE